jgi:diacylglycerol kinase (CTP)
MNRPKSSSMYSSQRSSASFFPTGFPVRLHVRTDLHLLRKTWHMTMGLIIASVYMSGMNTSTALVIMSTALGFDLLMETARLRIPAVNDRIMRIWGPVMRSCEVNRLSGIVYYIAAALLAIAIFPRPVATLSILYLACGDPIASLFGILYGHKSIRLGNGKSFVGTAAGVLTCTAVTFIFLKTLPVSGANLAILTLVGGVAGGTAELVPLDMDDNFTIPVFSGFALWLAFILLGI